MTVLTSKTRKCPRCQQSVWCFRLCISVWLLSSSFYSDSNCSKSARSRRKDKQFLQYLKKKVRKQMYSIVHTAGGRCTICDDIRFSVIYK